MSIYKIAAFLLISGYIGFGQDVKMRSLSDLINQEEPGWNLVSDWIRQATNRVEVLEKVEAQAETALYQTQVTTRSPMGSIIFETGGILVDSGWIHILGPGKNPGQPNQ